MSLSHKILETIGQSALDKGLVNKKEYSKVKDLHRGQKEAHRKAKKLGIEDRYLPKDISQEDFIKDIDNEEKNRGIKESDYLTNLQKKTEMSTEEMLAFYRDIENKLKIFNKKINERSFIKDITKPFISYVYVHPQNDVWVTAEVWTKDKEDYTYAGVGNYDCPEFVDMLKSVDLENSSTLNRDCRKLIDILYRITKNDWDKVTKKLNKELSKYDPSNINESVPVAPLEKRKPYRVFVPGDRVILRKLHNPDFYTEDYVRYYNENYKGKTGVIESKHYQGTLPIYTVKFDDPMLYKDYYEDSTVNVQAEDIDFYDEIKESTRYGDIDPEVVKDDAFLNIDKNENGYSVKAGIGDHTDLGSGNYTFIPDNEVSRLYNEVLDKVKSKKIKYHDKLGKEEVNRLDSIIPNYNKDLEQDIKDLEPYANRLLKRRELDDILDITGRRDASGSSERQMKHRLSGDYGKLSSKVGDLKRYLSDLDDDNITEFWIN